MEDSKSGLGENHDNEIGQETRDMQGLENSKKGGHKAEDEQGESSNDVTESESQREGSQEKKSTDKDDESDERDDESAHCLLIPALRSLSSEDITKG
jgi:hypothetical protein